MIKTFLATLFALITSTVIGSLLTALGLTWSLHGGLIAFLGLFMGVAMWAFLYLLVLSVVLFYPIWTVIKRFDNVVLFSLLGFCSGVFLHLFINYSIFLMTDFELTLKSLSSGDGVPALLFHAVIGGVFGLIYAFSLAAAYRSLCVGVKRRYREGV